MFIVLLLAAIGFCTSLYGFFVKQKLARDPNYKPACDISDKASCSKPFQSPYSRLFGISNTITGMIFYAVMSIATLLGFHTIVLLFAAGGAVVSAWLAYILYFKIKTFCLICTITYLVNIGLLIATIL